MFDNIDQDKELLQQIAEGNQESFVIIYNRYHKKVYSLAFHFTRSETAAEEILQDVFLKVWLKHRTLPEIRDFSSWLFIIARNHIYTHLKQRAQQIIFEPLNEEHVAPAEAESILTTKEFTTLLNDALAQLPPQQHQVYQLSKEENLSREQIAEKMNISPETVKVHLSRAMRTIRAYIMARMPVSLALFIFWKIF